MRRFSDIAMLGIMVAALAFDPMAAAPRGPKPKDEEEIEAEAHRRAPMTETNAPNPNRLKQAQRLPHQGKREMLRRLKRMRGRP